jgi:uncharacterized protein YeeX (DUF496 family)
MADYLVKKFIYKTSNEEYGDPIVDIYADLVDPPLVNLFIKRTVWPKINFTQQSAKDAVQFETEIAGVFGPGNNDFYKLAPPPPPQEPPIPVPVSSSIEIEYSIEGIIVDSTNNNKKLSGVKISANQNEITSKLNGKFVLKGKTTTDKKINISISKKGYSPQEIIPYFGDDSIKSDLGVIQLQLIQKSLEQDKIDSTLLTDSQINGLTKSIKTSSSFLQKKLTTSIINVKSRLIPLILTLIAGFGVTQVNKLIDKGKTKISDIQNQTTCPTQPELAKIISRKNRLVKQLNRLLKVIQSAEKFISSIKKLIDTISTTISGLDIASLALPSSIPPGVGIPVGIINKSGDIINLLKNQIKSEQGKIDNLASPLTLLKSVIAQALQYLNLLDNLVQYCYPDANQEQISAELTAITTDESNQESPVVTDVNGFTMGVETEPQISTLSIKRRRATATNKQGVIMLTGEWSFSSIDQILIDELVFYIQTNDLRAD